MTDDAPPAEATAPPVTVPGQARDLEPAADRAGREPGELLAGLSPRQIIGGFTLIAGVIVWLARRSRRKR